MNRLLGDDLIIPGIIMKMVKNLSFEKLMAAIASLALMIGVISVSNACFFAFAQPKVPQEIKKFTANK